MYAQHTALVPSVERGNLDVSLRFPAPGRNRPFLHAQAYALHSAANAYPSALDPQPSAVSRRYGEQYWLSRAAVSSELTFRRPALFRRHFTFRFITERQ